MNDKYFSRDNLEMLIEGFKVSTRKHISDWDQNDSRAYDYVKNRTHYIEIVEEVIIPRQVVDFGIYDGSTSLIFTTDIVDFNGLFNFIIFFDGKEYKWTGASVDDYFENELFSVRFTLFYGPHLEFTSTPIKHIVGCVMEKEVVHKLDPKYIDSTYFATIENLEDVRSAVSSVAPVANTAKTSADKAQKAADKAQATADTKMDASNPVGTGSFSMNRLADSAVGDYSSANGYNTVAKGPYSCASGLETIASAKSASVSGEYNVEDILYKKNSGLLLGVKDTNRVLCYSTDYSFDENTGTFTLISPLTSEGYLGNSLSLYRNKYFVFNRSKKEFVSDNVSGDCIAKIQEYTKLNSSGRIDNVMVTSSELVLNTRARYAHIVGNGTSDTERSNAHTLDWNGIGWYQGGLQVGGNAQDDGAKNVLLEGDAIPVPETAEVGQLLAVKTVDENGKPSEWESLDMPGSFVVRDTEPDDTSVLWVDPTDNSTEEFPESSGGGIAVTGATVGQTVKISAVDENGVPTAWESVDFPSGWGEEATGVLELIVDHTVTAEEAAATGFTFTKDKYPLIDGQKVLFARVVKPTGLGGWWKVLAGDTMIISGSSSTNPIQVGFAAVVHGLWLFNQANGENPKGSFYLSPALNGYLGAYNAINAKPYAYYDSLMVYSHTTAFPEGTTIEIYGA